MTAMACGLSRARPGCQKGGAAHPAFRMRPEAPRAAGGRPAFGLRPAGEGFSAAARPPDDFSAAGFSAALSDFPVSAAMLLRSASMRLTTFEGFVASSFGAGLLAALALMISRSAFW